VIGFQGHCPHSTLFMLCSVQVVSPGDDQKPSDSVVPLPCLYLKLPSTLWSRSSSVEFSPNSKKETLQSSEAGVAQSVYWLTTDRTTAIRSPAEAKDFSSNLCVQTGSEAHPTSCTMGTGGPFPGSKVRLGRDADHSPPASAEIKSEYELYLLSPLVPDFYILISSQPPFVLYCYLMVLLHQSISSFWPCL
jgi:hypothetical protein